MKLLRNTIINNTLKMFSELEKSNYDFLKRKPGKYIIVEDHYYVAEVGYDKFNLENCRELHTRNQLLRDIIHQKIKNTNRFKVKNVSEYEPHCVGIKLGIKGVVI